MKRINFLIVCFVVSVLCSCGGGGDSGIYTSIRHIAVDSVNDRLFLAQPRQQFFALTASTLESIGEEQPIVTDERNDGIYDLLPYPVSNMAVFVTGSTSRLFLMGGFVVSGETVLNRILVLDFDGTNFSEADFSPITISDGDDTTDEEDDAFADMIVDQDNEVLYVSDSSTGLLYAFSTQDGTQIKGPFDLTGTPQGMALDSDHLYVCNSSDVEAEQVITVLNVTDDTTTTIDVDAPCQLVAVQSNDQGAVMLVRQSDDQKVLIKEIDTTTYDDATDIVSDSDDYHDGYLAASSGITSSISAMTMARASDGKIYAYLSELDGNVEMVTFAANMSSYEFERLSTSAENITKGATLLDDDGDASDAFMVSEAGALISIEVGSTEVTVTD